MAAVGRGARRPYARGSRAGDPARDLAVVAALLAALVGVPAAWGACPAGTCYVDVDGGSDANPATKAAPLRTIQRAVTTPIFARKNTTLGI